LRKAGIDETAIRWPQNKEEIYDVVRQYVCEQASYGRCSTDWEKAGAEIGANEQMKQELTKNLRHLYLKWISHFEYKKRFSTRPNYIRLLSAKR
jgi:hypothetical protein